MTEKKKKLLITLISNRNNYKRGCISHVIFLNKDNSSNNNVAITNALLQMGFPLFC